MNISSVNNSAGYPSDKIINSGPVKEQNGTNDSITANPDNTVNNAINAPVYDKEQAIRNVDRILKAIHKPETTIERSIHEETNHVVYKVMNKETGKLIREIPEEKLLDMAAKLMELNGLMIDEKI
ncbi:flagellar protein FlaG [Paenibacillus radicis (ex Gao et al. 2016)]|uniref:Flagellar protein FlaG n=1 Tax=Paenibacillus radicis (ex Gao et al. 2016) TaxID=1737354 RepID=A0A917HMQ5_9BACL|nr:flagellar protein FlaG [Paenibacillus radicis (ex Gao et al. 2016)]GGG84465.1 hypothetical protein GCM10010918_47890 [Paenibacillus radicis (ex Gao et al. 2016)]